MLLFVITITYLYIGNNNNALASNKELNLLLEPLNKNTHEN